MPFVKALENTLKNYANKYFKKIAHDSATQKLGLLSFLRLTVLMLQVNIQRIEEAKQIASTLLLNLVASCTSLPGIFITK